MQRGVKSLLGPLQLDTSKNRLFRACRRREGSDRGFWALRGGVSGPVPLVFEAGAPLGTPFSCYAGALRPSSQARRWKL